MPFFGAIEKWFTPLAIVVFVGGGYLRGGRIPGGDARLDRPEAAATARSPWLAVIVGAVLTSSTSFIVEPVRHTLRPVEFRAVQLGLTFVVAIGAMLFAKIMKEQFYPNKDD